MGNIIGALLGWSVTGYLVVGARHRIAADLRRLRGLMPARGRYAGRGGDL